VLGHGEIVRFTVRDEDEFLEVRTVHHESSSSSRDEFADASRNAVFRDVHGVACDPEFQDDFLHGALLEDEQLEGPERRGLDFAVHAQHAAFEKRLLPRGVPDATRLRVVGDRGPERRRVIRRRALDESALTLPSHVIDASPRDAEEPRRETSLRPVVSLLAIGLREPEKRFLCDVFAVRFRQTLLAREAFDRCSEPVRELGPRVGIFEALQPPENRRRRDLGVEILHRNPAS